FEDPTHLWARHPLETLVDKSLEGSDLIVCLPQNDSISIGSQIQRLGGIHMAKKTIHISDLSGKEVPEGKGAMISIKFADARKGTYVLDVTDDEAEEL